MLSSQKIKKILAKIIPRQKFEKFSEEAKKCGKTLENYLIEKKITTSNSLYENAAGYFNMPFINLKTRVIEKNVLLNIPEPIASTHKIIAFAADDKEIKIAALDQENKKIIEFIGKKNNLKPVIFLTTPESFNEAIKQYHKSLKSEFKGLVDQKIENGAVDFKKSAENLSIVRIIDTLLEYAIFEDASDIHLEPEKKDIIAYYRVDGILKTVMTLPKNFQPGITARIKLLANLKINEHRLPQDGHFKINTREYKISFKVSIIPALDGEKIILHLLNEKTQILNLKQLGLQPSALKSIKKNISKPYGIILAAGPNNSGKTTTLHAVINVLNTPEVNIMTIEDPIEHRIPYINQSQVNQKIGYTFAAGLKAFLRQDPNIIMVGEIQDKEIAGIAIHAAMTGHLVLSTLHAKDAINALSCLSDMGIPPFLIASTTNIIIAQRLVRKICPNCIQSYNLDKQTIAELNQLFDLRDIILMLEKNKIIINAEQNLKNLLFYRGKGCKQCSNSGYKGKLGIYEVLEITGEMSELILKKASTTELKEQAKKQNMLTIIEDGFIKAKNGVTTIEEIIKIAKE
ncbi:MAG: GspE/PulE family protein [bacterium]